jgi:hypothetical protein
MTIRIEHFCTKTGLPIIFDGKLLTETIEHVGAEYFAPNATSKLGIVYSGLTTETDLNKFQQLGFNFCSKRA